ncbi:MAG TPA: hypothetical protein VGK47_14960 [Nitrososphaeraceae archaeon]
MNNDPLFWLYADNYRTYNIDVARRLRSIHAAILLAELASRQRYHRDRGELITDANHGEGWFYFTQELVEERTCLTRKNQDTSIEILEKFGLIEKKSIGIPAKRHFRLNQCRINEFFFMGQPCLSETDKLDCPKRTNSDVRNGQTGPREHTYKEPKEEPKEDSLSLSHSKPQQSDESDECVSFFVREIQKKDPKFRLSPSKQKEWQAELLSMNREDGRSWQEIKDIISYSQGDPFWASRANTAKNLRSNATTILVKFKSSPIQYKEELEAYKQKALDELIARNKQYAEFRAKSCKALLISDNCCQIKIGNNYFPLGYVEDNFNEKLDKIINEC